MFCGSGLYGAELSAAVVLLSELCKSTTKSSLLPLKKDIGTVVSVVDKMHH